MEVEGRSQGTNFHGLQIRRCALDCRRPRIQHGGRSRGQVRRVVFEGFLPHAVSSRSTHPPCTLMLTFPTPLLSRLSLPAFKIGGGATLLVDAARRGEQQQSAYSFAAQPISRVVGAQFSSLPAPLTAASTVAVISVASDGDAEPGVGASTGMDAPFNLLMNGSSAVAAAGARGGGASFETGGSGTKPGAAPSKPVPLKQPAASAAAAQSTGSSAAFNSGAVSVSAPFASLQRSSGGGSTSHGGSAGVDGSFAVPLPPSAKQLNASQVGGCRMRCS